MLRRSRGEKNGHWKYTPESIMSIEGEIEDRRKSKNQLYEAMDRRTDQKLTEDRTMKDVTGSFLRAGCSMVMMTTSHDKIGRNTKYRKSI